MSQDRIIGLECTKCRRMNYHSEKNKKKLKNRLELKKYCRHCKAHVAHKETKI
ncbi:MAG: 50S ribosomal protein L33 [Patescibacteria group bacterium]